MKKIEISFAIWKKFHASVIYFFIYICKTWKLYKNLLVDEIFYKIVLILQSYLINFPLIIYYVFLGKNLKYNSNINKSISRIF